ncbi:unnamed protein product [Didymodactylos carnosus]|uniref:Uncharacterized protein n=1 Tax=Didymodactylos carnosus TaxID=1234261 RepID=A0A815IPP8_9BILA|nr:unnamed protein product [Didymodactylos carnosus]CAF1367710.1 unnamed protein product [Didymodactylos carnosus]CAF4018500.1 unnamed protein product [Didymodactylos carnosus]CAF4250992.1 unnamed protein product [Didymodactylos carnosus]
MYIGKTRDGILAGIVGGALVNWNFSLFVNECLTPLMYLLKRHQNLDDFMEALSFKLSQIFGAKLATLPKISLRMLIHILLMKSDISLRRMILSLLCKRHPVPFVDPTIIDQHQQKQAHYQIVPEILHVWNYDRPTFLSFGVGPCFRKSTLMNAVFMSSFEQSTQSIYFQQTIDIDFGYSFLPSQPRKMNIADAHGQMTKQLLCKISELFDGFLVHVDYEFLERNNEFVLDFLDALPVDKYRLLIIRDLQRTVGIFS